MSLGDRREYAVSMIGVMSFQKGGESKSGEMSSQGRSVESVEAIKPGSGGQQVYEYRTETHMAVGANTHARHTVAEEKRIVTPKGVEVVATRMSDEGGVLSGKWESYDPPLLLYKAGAKPGTAWQTGTVREGDIRIPGNVRVMGYETVAVPAGEFRKCLKLCIMTDKVSGTVPVGPDKLPIKSGKGVDSIWIAPGAGVVKEDSMLQVIVDFPPTKDGEIITATATQRRTRELLPGYKVSK